MALNATPSDTIIKFIELAVWLLCIALWAVIGFLIWVPLLVRVTGYLAFLTLHGALTGSQRMKLALPARRSANVSERLPHSP